MDEITLGSTEFKALSSDTRTQIIKMLKERNYTLSEISKKLNLAAPTVKQHLEILEQSGIVSQTDTGHKWKYYTLTRKGKGITGGRENANILIMIGVSVIALAVLLVGMAGTLNSAVLAQPASLDYGAGASDQQNMLSAPAPSEKSAEDGLETTGVAGSETSEECTAGTECAAGYEETNREVMAEPGLKYEYLLLQPVMLASLAAAIALILLIGYLLCKLKSGMHT